MAYFIISVCFSKSEASLNNDNDDLWRQAEAGGGGSSSSCHGHCVEVALSSLSSLPWIIDDSSQCLFVLLGPQHGNGHGWSEKVALHSKWVVMWLSDFLWSTLEHSDMNTSQYDHCFTKCRGSDHFTKCLGSDHATKCLGSDYFTKCFGSDHITKCVGT